MKKENLAVALSIASRNRKKYANGGRIPDEKLEMPHKSIAKAIMHKRSVKPSEDEPLMDIYPELNEDAADFTSDSDLPDFPQPESSNQVGMSRIDRIRQRIKSR